MLGRSPRAIQLTGFASSKIVEQTVPEGQNFFVTRSTVAFMEGGTKKVLAITALHRFILGFHVQAFETGVAIGTESQRTKLVPANLILCRDLAKEKQRKEGGCMKELYHGYYLFAWLM